MSDIKHYTKEIEELFLQFFMSDIDLYVRCKGIIRGEHYRDVKHKKIIEFLNNYSNEHASLPTRQQILALYDVEINVLERLTEDDRDWFLNEYEKFSRHREMEIVVHGAPDLMNEGRYGEVEANIKTAVSIGLVKDLGTDYFKDPKQRLEDVRNNDGKSSTGWKSLDEKLYGGFERGALNIFAGQSGAGKSVFLQNIAVNWVNKGLNVVYLSLELSEKLCAMRIDAMMTGYGTKDVLKNIDNVVMNINTGKKAHNGSLCIKQLPNGCTANDIRAYIKEYETQKGFKVDAILLDYLDLCMPTNIRVSPSDLFVKDKYVSENLRDLSVELDILFVTASQLNRCLTLDTQVEIESKGTIQIKDIEIGDKIKSHDGYNTVTDVFPITKQDVYEITTKSGKKIRCSGNHIFPSSSGEKTIYEGLKVGDKLHSGG